MGVPQARDRGGGAGGSGGSGSQPAAMSSMRHVNGIADAGTWDPGHAVDRVVRDADDRVRGRVVLTPEKGATLLLDFAEPTMLRDGDGLVLDDGSIVIVAGQAEPLIKISAKGPIELVRL